MRNTKLLEDAGKIASEAVENIRTVAGLNNQLLFHRKYCANLVQPFKFVFFILLETMPKVLSIKVFTV